jgi:putative conjugative transposon membrane protein
MNKINKKIGILIGVGTAITIGTIMSVLIKKKIKNLSKFEEDEFGLDFGDIEDESFVKNEFDTENAKNNVRKEERDSLEDKFLDYESKTEEESRDLLVKGMNSFLKEIISMSKILNSVKNDIETMGDTKALVEELRSCEEEIISLWEHIEKLADTRIDIDNKKGRV